MVLRQGAVPTFWTGVRVKVHYCHLGSQPGTGAGVFMRHAILRVPIHFEYYGYTNSGYYGYTNNTNIGILNTISVFHILKIKVIVSNIVTPLFVRIANSTLGQYFLNKDHVL